MNNFTKTSELLSEMASNPTMTLKKELESPDWGYTIKGGNGLVKKKGKNLMVYDSYYIGSDEALKRHVRGWSKGGEYEKYFGEQGYTIKVKSSGINMKSKHFSAGDVYVELEVK